ncbi:DNA-binding PadR family transcriptional regulator [Desulfallas thermosapovorans DSM 6562]|uniref:DNA-binding PadR family transcriptional regulator n=2 Tax=Desulfallas thermosapovorans TaxID=58137 RepID=A0A5S4ZV71_9FIRM|nr:DNA-binding PadR family transcriptional regulator [Desulfallas thermosapovorans DSM 6562]
MISISIIVSDTNKIDGDKMRKPYQELIDASKLSGGLLLRGLLPFYVLSLLAREKMYGKQIIDQITIMTGGNWKPSPGSIYPILQKMVRLGFVAHYMEDSKGKSTRVYEITGLGRDSLRDMREEIKPRLKNTIELLNKHLKELESS